MLHNSSMKSIKTKVKFLNKETGKITTIQKGFDSFEMGDARALREYDKWDKAGLSST